MELSSANMRQIMQLLQLQQQEADSISSTTPLAYQSPESPSAEQIFSIETFRGVGTNIAGDGDNNFGEEFFLEELRSTHVYVTPSVGVQRWHQEAE